jgi:predicted dehydrogenase
MFKLAVIGLDTSHATVFTELIQDKEKKMVDKLQVVSCMRFPTPFHAEPDQDKRQELLENLDVKVTRSFEEAVAGVDGIMIEINDPAFHIEYFEKCADLGLPIFLDKPMADNIENGIKMYNIAKEKNIKIWSSSSLRFTPEIIDCASKVKKPDIVNVFGPLGKAASGSSLVWYGVHSFEMLMTLMGSGAEYVYARKDARGIISIIEYGDGRRGIVECNDGAYKYGGSARNTEFAENYVTAGSPYPHLIAALETFFIDNIIPVPFEETLEIQAMMDAAGKSLESGKKEAVYKL